MIKLLEDKDYLHAAHLASLAYPGMDSQTPAKREELAERLKKEQETENHIRFYGYFDEEEKLKGMYRISDFTMNLNGKLERILGIGMVAVHLLHKKERIAFNLLADFHEQARKEGVGLVALYPFNPSFYRKMGYGYGPLKYEYTIKPDTIITDGVKDNIRYLDAADEEKMVALFDEYASNNHGMIQRTWSERQHIKNGAAHYVGVEIEGVLVGALAFSLKKVSEDNFLHQRMYVHEWYWSSVEGYRQLAAWLHSQQDQVYRIVLRTFDTSFIYTLTNPSNGSNRLIPSVYHESATVGSGLMYRIVNIPVFVQALQNTLQTPAPTEQFLMRVEDTFIPEQAGIYEMSFDGDSWSALKIQDTKEEILFNIAIQELSAWLMGCTSLEELSKYGIVEVDVQTAIQLDNWLKPRKSPICLTNF